MHLPPYLPHIILPLLLAATLLTACDKGEDTTPTPPTLVIEGWIEDGDFPVVMVGESRQMGSANQSADEYMVRWAKVTISNGTQTAILTGRYDPQLFPPYKYTTYNFMGEAGKTYTLTAEYRQHKVTATTTIPEPVRLLSAQAVRLQGCDSLYYITAHFEDNPHTQDYYGLFSQVEGKDRGYLLSFPGIYTDGVLGTDAWVDVFRGNSLQQELEGTEMNDYYRAGDVVSVKLRHMDRTSFGFWQSFTAQSNLAGNLFFPYQHNLASNIQGGKGYWCGYGTSSLRVKVGN